MEALFFFLLYPPITGYYATEKGYKFWHWFLLGLALPIISGIILMFLKDRPVIKNEIAPWVSPDRVLYKKD